MTPCTGRHDWGEGRVCLVCGMTAQEYVDLVATGPMPKRKPAPANMPTPADLAASRGAVIPAHALDAVLRRAPGMGLDLDTLRQLGAKR